MAVWKLKPRKYGRKWLIIKYDEESWLEHKVRNEFGLLKFDTLKEAEKAITGGALSL